MAPASWKTHEDLVGTEIRLEPLSHRHFDLLRLHFSPSFTDYYPQSLLTIDEYFNEVVEKEIFGSAQVFSIVKKYSGEAVGCTGFFNLAEEHRRLEIGGTWIGKSSQHSAVNVESKLLLLDYAFRERRCLRVEFKTDSLNVPSQMALEKLGATREGSLRNHMLRPDGRVRHSIYYSIIVEDWPMVRDAMLLRLESNEESSLESL